MAITLRAAGAIANGGVSGTSVAIPQPTGTAADDFMVAVVVDAATSGTSTTPDGWTPVVNTAGAAGRVQIFYAVKGYSANLPVATSWTWTGLTAKCGGYIVGYYNASHAGVTGTATATYAASGGAISNTGLTTGANGSMVIGVYASLGSNRTWSSETCATMGALSEANGSADQAYGSNFNIAVAANILATAGATGANTGTPSNNTANIVALLAIAPAAIPTVTGTTPDNITSSTATGHGNVTSDGGGLITERGICVNTTGTPTIGDTKFTQTGTTGAYNVPMTGLSSNQLYYYRTYGTNGIGTGYCTQGTFTTSVAAGGVLKIWDGNQWNAKVGKVNVGGTFVKKPWKRWDGNQWLTINTG